MKDTLTDPQEYSDMLEEIYDDWLELSFRLGFPQDALKAGFDVKVIEEIREVIGICERALQNPAAAALQKAHSAYYACKYTSQWIFRIKTGTIQISPGAHALDVDLDTYLERYRNCDWSELTKEHQAFNELARKRHKTLATTYMTPNGMLWIVTSADRTATFLLVPAEYFSLWNKDEDQTCSTPQLDSSDFTDDIAY